MSCPYQTAFPGEGILTDLAKRLVDKTITEVNYFLHFKTHLCEFEQQHNELDAKFEEVNNDIEDAKRRNENPTKDVEVWKDKAYILIQENHRIKQTWSYSSCPHWRYRQGKRLAKRMLLIKDHIQKFSFERVARPAKLPGIKYHARDFIDFESRKSKLKQLVEALKDGNHYMVGLQGMGGTGKTTLATQVGKQLEESKAFENVIFIVMSNPPDINKIRGDIARQLGLHLEETTEADHSKLLWFRISNEERKLLIILDDVWEKLNLTDIGIPFGPNHKNCYVLITTRHSRVCEEMRCQKTIHLHTLIDEDALNLFLFHAASNDGFLRKELEDLARDFVKECGGLPIAIVSLASTLRIWPVSEWKEALATLRKSEQFLNVDEDLVQVYRCLSLSYENMRNEKAQKLFLLCSIFPEDYKIPINFIIRLGIGAGIFGKVEDYCVARSQVLGVKNELVASTLLLRLMRKNV
ncbi:disease resistance protein SUMM2-like [Prosopis cineraria]|uniref:disease resistance protein SUMM2-like n=1 Tax=Prosopis cineraria TaxID=364024 RepID=UPI002410A9A2|nr:disease resistance protein SUMM2-like [Prosopis cineraria]